MLKFLKYFVGFFATVFFLSVAYVLIFDSEPVYEKPIQVDDLTLISSLQDWCFDKNMTDKHLAKFPSFNLKTRDFKKFGKDDFYLYSEKLNFEIRIREGICIDIYSGSKWL